MKYEMNRFLVAFGAFLLVLSVAGFFIFQVMANYKGFSINLLLFLVVPFLAGLAILMLAYLRGGQKLYAPRDFTDSQNISLNSYDSKEADNLKDKIDSLIEKIGVLEKNPLGTNIGDQLLKDFDSNDLINNIKEQINTSLSSDFLTVINAKYGDSISKSLFIGELSNRCERTETRLRNEIESLTRRGNLNLIIGVLTTIVAVAILSSTVVFNDLPTEPNKLAAHFFPRLSLSMFIEIFSFFFLRLYSSSLNEIKFFQNELTNVESRFIALHRAVHSGDDKSLGMILKKLVETERNFVLKKGETTVDLEKCKLDQQSMKEMLVAFVDTVKPKK